MTRRKLFQFLAWLPFASRIIYRVDNGRPCLTMNQASRLLIQLTNEQTEAPIQAMRQMTVQADQDMKATTGIYDAALGI